jgi:hypothetical protein
MQMAEERQEHPRDDIATKLITAEIDGNHLTIDEFGFFMILLSVAGNETTRNAITHGMLAFFDHPDQWELFKAERPKTFVDEVIRWATPVNVFQRTASKDVEFRGQPIRKGDRVCIFYGSANFDEDVFANPHGFDILRTPNPHLGFGGSGAHYCLGANLARLEIELIFNEIADQMPDIRKVDVPERLYSGWVHGIKALPVAYGEPGSPVAGRSDERIATDLVTDVMAAFHRTHQPGAADHGQQSDGQPAAKVPAPRKPRPPKAATQAKAGPATAGPVNAAPVKASKAAKVAGAKAVPAQAGGTAAKAARTARKATKKATPPAL